MPTIPSAARSSALSGKGKVTDTESGAVFESVTANFLTSVVNDR